MGKRRQETERVEPEEPPSTPELPTEGVCPYTPEEKATIFFELMKELQKMGLDPTPEGMTLLLKSRHPELKLSREDLPLVKAALARLQKESPPDTSHEPAPNQSLSTVLALVKGLVRRFGASELKRIIDLFG